MRKEELDENAKILIESELFDAIRAFHDLDNKEERNQVIREFTIKFCMEHNIDIAQTIDLLKELFEKRREMNKMFPYEHFVGNNLNRIILEEEEK